MIEIIRAVPRKVIGIKVSGEWEALWLAMPQAWQEFRARAQEIRNRVNSYFIDLSLGQDDGIYTQFICAEVSEISMVPLGMTSLQIPRQTYLHCRHDGPLEDIATSFGAIYQWARTNGLVAEEFKIDEGYTQDGRHEEHELYVRVVPRIPAVVAGIPA